MQKREELIRKLKELSKTPVCIIPATVKEVDEANLHCKVQPLDGPEIFEVRLKAAIDEVTDGFVQIPAVNSTVLIAMIGNDSNTWLVIAFSQVTKVKFYNGSNGGLINIQTLIENLDKTNEVVNAIKDSLLNWTPVGGDGGAALKTLASSNLAGKATGVFDNMEDNKVLH